MLLGTESLEKDGKVYKRLRNAVFRIHREFENEVGCRDNTVPKTVDTRRHHKVGLRVCNMQSSATPSIRCSQPSSQWLLVSTVFGTVSLSLHFYTCNITVYTSLSSE